MTTRDKGLDIDLIDVQDILDNPVSKENLEGATICVSPARHRQHYWEDSGKAKETVGLSGIKYWIVIDRGPYRMQFDRYIAIPVSEDQDIHDVEQEERGVAIPGIYYSIEEAATHASQLSSIFHIMED